MKFIKTFIILSLICLLLLPAYTEDSRITNTVLPDGVEHWQKVAAQKQKPWFWQLLENLANVVFGNTEKLPFTTSTALLVGVSEYRYLRPQLDFVEKDLEMMREYLLGMGGFDEVYVMKNKAATPGLVKDYMQNKFTGLDKSFKALDKNSRLLFYYSGHGADYKGGTGYMQFCEAKKEDSVNHVLEIDICEKWSTMLDVKHMLFIFDCCASGLAYDPKGDKNFTMVLADTLGGNGSRTVITAGTADEESFGVEGRSVFTHALLSALANERYTNDGLLTVDQAFGELRSIVARFSTRYNKKMTSRIWNIDKDYKGTFIFIDPMIKEKDFAGANEQTLDIVPKGDILIETTRHNGNLAVDVQTGGDLYLGDALMKTVPASSTTILKKILTGDYTMMMRYEDGYKEIHAVTVKKDTTVKVEFFYVPVKLPDWLVFVEGGTFHMGSETGDSYEKPVHEVTVDSFYMSKYEVTQEEYLEFCNKAKTNYPEWLETGNEYNIHTGTKDYYKPHAGTGKEKHPIVGISWYDATAYCNWLSNEEGLKPCYSGSGDAIVCDFTVNGYRLPTEAEWEFAARGGKESKGYEYSGSNDAKEVAWYLDNAGSTTHPVAQKKSNELGLHDMSGNVREWCWDWYGTYTGESAKNPRGPDKSGSRVLRGGSWVYVAWYVRSASRFWFVPGYRDGFIGFRPARGH